MFKDIQKRILTFLVLCIGARLGLAYLAKNLSGKWSLSLATIIAAIGMGFLIIYFGGLRKTGVETWKSYLVEQFASYSRGIIFDCCWFVILQTQMLGISSYNS